MSGPQETLLASLANSAAYSAGDGFGRVSASCSDAAADFDSAASDPGLMGLSGLAATASFAARAGRIRGVGVGVSKIAPILVQANAIRSHAADALHRLPSADVPATIKKLAEPFGLLNEAEAVFAARREFAARIAVQSASQDFAGLTAQMTSAGYDIDPQVMQVNGATTDETADGQYRIGPPQKPDIEWDEDYIYNSEDGGFGDWISKEKWLAKHDGARLLRWDLKDALDAYAHYWSNTGDDWAFDYEKAYRDDAGVRASIDEEIVLAQQAADELASGGNTSFQFTGNATATSQAHYAQTENWQKTIGGHQQWASGDVTVKDGVATMVVTVHGEDRYNFNRGQSDIESGAPDDENGRFTEIGWAKPFDSSGSVTRTVTWNVGDPGSATVSEPPEGGR